MIHPRRGAGHGSRVRTVTSRTRARSPERAGPSFTDSNASAASARRDRRSRARPSPPDASAVPTKGLARRITRSSEKQHTFSRAAPSPQRRARSRLVSREPTHVPSSVYPRVLPSRTRVESPPLPTTEPTAAPVRTDPGFRDALFYSFAFLPHAATHALVFSLRPCRTDGFVRVLFVCDASAPSLIKISGERNPEGS